MTYSYLALGDSYTIGELVPLHESFPYQTVQMLRKKLSESDHFIAPEIIAKTGWTTDELDDAITKTILLPKYDVVSLLIGVNNQYRGRSLENYEEEFEKLLSYAIRFAGNNHKRVFVISIPDWGVTPFAEGKDRDVIAKEIDEYNEACKQITLSHQCSFIDITTSQRKDGNKVDFLASDGLHPSGAEYNKWAQKLAEEILLTF
jgi:lysophospholipase L1-like esterase